MSKHTIDLKVNCHRYELAVEPHWTLLEMVREELGLTGSKEGSGARLPPVEGQLAAGLVEAASR